MRPPSVRAIAASTMVPRVGVLPGVHGIIAVRQLHEAIASIVSAICARVMHAGDLGDARRGDDTRVDAVGPTFCV